MKVRSAILTQDDIINATRELPGVEIAFCNVRPARKPLNGWDVGLIGNSRYSNSSRTGKAATYDEWGMWLAVLFTLDPNAVCGRYKGANDFHAQTDSKFRAVQDA